jgi:hypothetical protein
MELNIPERITLISLLPKEGHYADVISLRRTKEVLSLTPEEVQEIQYREEDTGKGLMAYFDITKATELVRDVPIDEWTTKTVQNDLAKKEKEGKLSDSLISLYEKFVIAHE